MSEENVKINKKNLNRLSLSFSQRKKKSKINKTSLETYSSKKSPIKNDVDLCPETTSILKVEKLSQLNTNDSAIKCNFVATNINLENVITLSSDDEVFEQKINKIKKKTKLKKNLETPEKNEENIIEEKPRTKRKLTRTTNLKTFSAKDQPENQTNLEQYFTLTPNPNGVKYFDTFIKSKKSENNDLINNDLDCLESIMNDVKNDSSQQNNSESVRQHFQLKKKSKSQKIQNKLLNKVIATDSYNSFGENTMTTANIYNSDNESRYNSSESIVFYYNSIPSIKAESVDYSLADENTTVHRSSRLNSKNITITNNAEEIVNTKTKLAPKNVRKRLSFRESTTKNLESKNDDLNSSSSGVKLLNSNVSSVKETSNSSKNTNSNSSNSVFGIGEYKYNSYNNPIIINDDENENIPSIKLRKLSKLKKSNVKEPNSNKESVPQTRRNRVLKCPSYKIIEGTTFAVDGFRYGEIEGVTHYFLTHFHADHYIGLRKSFSMPIYMSKITATLVSSFIHVDPDFLHIINPNETKIINGIEVTSIDANHCPGAVMFTFKLPNGKCILHTGDFRASPEMESEPYFWNNNIETIYLDTTYLNKNYNFIPQSESITDIRYYIEDFREKHIGQKILFVCGSYVIGKEKVWVEIANITKHRVYTNGNRRKALQAIGDPDLLKYLTDDPMEANIHVLTMNEVNYLKLYDYFQLYNDYFDVLLAIRPSGWEKNSKPRYSGIINIVGIEYSEHSSYSELRRFCHYLQPKTIISTVPINNSNMSITTKIPEGWCNSSVQPRQQGYQPSICSYISATSTKRADDDQQSCPDIGMLHATTTSMVVSPDKYENLSDDWMS